MSPRTRIKVCGITCHQDAQMAVAAGVDALGFIFAARSPRCVPVETAAAIIRSLPPFVDAVGVFVNQPLDTLVDIVTSCRLDTVQLHGDEDPAFCQNLARLLPCCTLIKAFRVSAETAAAQFIPYSEVVSGFLLDTYSQKMAGGTGETFDWRIIPKLGLQRPIILAGGITADNAATAVNQIKPHALDVNSGVEDAPGRKNKEKLMALIASVRLAEQQILLS